MEAHILSLSEIAQMPQGERQAAFKEKFGTLAQDELLSVFSAVLDVTVSYAESCNEALFLHLVTTGDFHPHAVDKLNLPSFHTALKGVLIAQHAPNQDVLCDSCAYRCGTLANHSECTQADLEYALSVENTFYCHKEIENLDCPTEVDRKRMKPCKGWAQHIKRLKSAEAGIA